MIRFAICDDEPVALDMLQDALEGAFHGQEIAVDDLRPALSFAPPS